jgi:hypothetical protein
MINGTPCSSRVASGCTRSATTFCSGRAGSATASRHCPGRCTSNASGIGESNSTAIPNAAVGSKRVAPGGRRKWNGNGGTGGGSPLGERSWVHHCGGAAGSGRAGGVPWRQAGPLAVVTRLPGTQAHQVPDEGRKPVDGVGSEVKQRHGKRAEGRGQRCMVASKLTPMGKRRRRIRYFSDAKIERRTSFTRPG